MPGEPCCLGVVIWLEAVEVLQVLFAGSAWLELVVSLVLG